MDFVVGNCYRKVVIYMGELFYLTWNTGGNILSFGVLHFGPKNETNNFKYGIKIGSSDVYVAVTRKCHSYLEGGLNNIKPRNCGIAHLFQIREHIGEQGELSCEIEIGKWKLDGFVSEGVLESISSFRAICNSESNSGSRANAEEKQRRQQQQQRGQQQQAQQRGQQQQQWGQQQRQQQQAQQQQRQQQEEQQLPQCLQQ
jgi:hypothetical protein